MSSCEQNITDVREDVKEYYGKTLQTNEDLQSDVCAFKVGNLDKHVTDAMKLVHPEVSSKSYGCGLAVPEHLEGMNILDLGCGGGHDCFALSKLVGENGHITGVDMTDEMLAVANKYVKYHMDAFGYQNTNVKFVKGYLENLRDAGIEDSSADIIISNCVINLCKDKKSVLEEAFRVLKDGGELYFSDMYADRVVPDHIRSNKVLWGEGMGGALYWRHLFSIAKEIGFETPRTTSSSAINIIKPDVKELVGDVRYAAVGYRLFKLPKNTARPRSEATYKGGIAGREARFQFDCNHEFCKDTPVTVDGSTAAILRCSRFADVFAISKSEETSSQAEVVEVDPFAIAMTKTKACRG